MGEGEIHMSLKLAVKFEFDSWLPIKPDQIQFGVPFIKQTIKSLL